MNFELLVTAAAVIGGTMTAIAGAGTGSVLVPLFALHFDFKLAVAAVALPHLVAGGIRAFQLRLKIDQSLLVRFGIVCAIASLMGAIVHTFVSSSLVNYTFAILLLIAGILGLSGLSERIRFGRSASFVGGGLSGFFGGLAGEQGGFRAVALLGFQLQKEAFVATGTAVAVIIDIVRSPVYIVSRWTDLESLWGLIALAVGGVAVGTLLGGFLLKRIPQKAFSRIVSGIILIIGILLLSRPSG